MSAFETMKAGLVARGLLDRDGRVTPAGDAWTDQLIAYLDNAPEPEGPQSPPKTWNTGRNW